MEILLKQQERAILKPSTALTTSSEVAFPSEATALSIDVTTDLKLV